jgi:hypothetical protein
MRDTNRATAGTVSQGIPVATSNRTGGAFPLEAPPVWWRSRGAPL